MKGGTASKGWRQTKGGSSNAVNNLLNELDEGLEQVRMRDTEAHEWKNASSRD